MTLHIYTTGHQPAHRYRVDLGGMRRALWCRASPRALGRCWKCRKLRWLKYLTVQVYYDQVPMWCRPGHGCALMIGRELRKR